ncbi:MAG: peroxiredoxin family protein [Aureispira sp.]
MITSIIVKSLHQVNIDLMMEYKGKPLVLLFYNNDCLGCTGRAIPLAHQYQQAHPALQIIGIHSNFRTNNVSKEDIEGIFTIPELPFPIYIDENHQAYDDFHCEGTPQWVLITKEGELYRSIFGSQLGAQNRLSYALEALVNDHVS